MVNDKYYCSFQFENEGPKASRRVAIQYFDHNHQSQNVYIVEPQKVVFSHALPLRGHNSLALYMMPEPINKKSQRAFINIHFASTKRLKDFWKKFSNWYTQKQGVLQINSDHLGPVNGQLYAKLYGCVFNSLKAEMKEPIREEVSEQLPIELNVGTLHTRSLYSSRWANPCIAAQIVNNGSPTLRAPSSATSFNCGTSTIC